MILVATAIAAAIATEPVATTAIAAKKQVHGNWEPEAHRDFAGMGEDEFEQFQDGIHTDADTHRMGHLHGRPSL